MAKSLIGTETTTESSTDKTKAGKAKLPGAKGPATSADQINGWANGEIIIRETDVYLAGVLEKIRNGQRVNLKGEKVTSLDRYNPT